MSTKYQNYITGDDSFESIYWLDTSNLMQGQSFTVATAHKIVYIKVKVYRVGSPGILTAHIYKVTAGQEYYPIGTPLVSGTFDGDTLTTDTDGEWITITLDNYYNLDVGSPYAIVLSAYSGNATNKVCWRLDGSTPTFNGGRRVQYTAALSWQHASTDNMMFEEWGDPTVVIDKLYSKKLVAAGNDEVWYESAGGTMTELAAANGYINTNNPLTVAEAFQKVFIANQGNLKIIDFANDRLTSEAQITTNIPSRGNVLTQAGDSPASMIVDYIYYNSTTLDHYIYGYTTAGTFDLTHNVIDSDSNVIISSANLSAVSKSSNIPLWYDWTPYNNNTTTYGSMPSSAYLVCRYRGRLVLSGHPNYPHQWYMAKVSDPFNWKYGSTDPLTAVAGNNVDAGEVGDIVRALIPYGDDFLIFGCADSIHILDGDPAFGGSIDELSNITGMYGPWAWCKDEDGNLYFWGSGGLYKMEGGRSKPKNISQGHLPKWVSDWAADPNIHRIVLTYDPSRNGIIISRTTLADGTNLNYWYDLKTEGFYPETYPTACGIFSSWYYDSDASGTRELILGGNDGYLRTFLDTAKNDDSGASDTAISSYLTLPIIKLSEIEDSEGKLTSLTIELAGGLATTKLTHTALTTAHAKGDTLTQAISDDITVFADYGGTVTGTVKATSATHGLPAGTTTGIIISGTTNYNGTFTVTYIDANNFYFTDTWVSDDATGAWNKNTTMTVVFTDSSKLNTFGYASNGTFNIIDSVTGSGSGSAFTPTAVGTGSFSDTDGVSYELHVGDDAETVLEAIKGGATARESGTLSGAGRKNRIRKRVRGRWLGIKFYNSTASETFAINTVTGEIKPAGKIK